MRITTPVHAAVRNIGDSQDGGTFYSGPLGEVIYSLTKHLAETTMATRIAIGIGRNKEDAARGIEIKGSSASGLSFDVESMLQTIFNESGQEITKAEGDDYEQ